MWLEKQGGRSYPFFLDGYDGPLTISKRAYEAAGKCGPRLLLSAVRRDVRAVFGVPPGWLLLEVDFRSCHAAIGVALSGDEQLAADVDADIHQVIGDRMFRSLRDAAGRRAAGKELNNAMLFGMSPAGLRMLTRNVLGRDPKDGTGERGWAAWWLRYPDLAAFRDEVRGLVRQAQVQRSGLEIEAPSGRVSKFRSAELAGKSFKGGPDRPPEGVWPTIFSAAFRTVEGDLLDGTLRRFHGDGAGGQPVLPLFDGLIAAAPSGEEDAVRRALEDAAERAAQDLGLDRIRAEAKQREA